MIILVVRDNIEVDTRDDHGCSLLSYATQSWHDAEAVVKILLTWDDIEVDTKDDHGRSLLSYAIIHFAWISLFYLTLPLLSSAAPIINAASES